MGLKDRLLQAKCKVGAHSGEWRQIAAGSCDEQRTCAHCGTVSSRTEHHLTNWDYVDDPAAPACTQECHCQRCPLAEQRVEHAMSFRHHYAGLHEACRQREDCTRCGFTQGRTRMSHVWNKPVEFEGDYSIRKVWACMACEAKIVRDVGSADPREDSHDYAENSRPKMHVFAKPK